jgi:hypothetical protein
MMASSLKNKFSQKMYDHFHRMLPPLMLSQDLNKNILPIIKMDRLV